jgi:hypothetical protein
MKNSARKAQDFNNTTLFLNEVQQTKKIVLNNISTMTNLSFRLEKIIIIRGNRALNPK